MKNLFGLILGIGLAGTFVTLNVSRATPVGTIKGISLMKENGKGLADAYVRFDAVESTPGVESARSMQTRKDGSFEIRNVPVGFYKVYCSGEHHSLDEKTIRVEEGKVTETKLELDPNTPYVRLYASQKVFTPTEKPQIDLHGFTPEDSLDLRVYRLDPDKVTTKGGLNNAVQPLGNINGRAPSSAIDPIAQLVSETKHEIKKKDAEGAYVEKLQMPPLAEGLYVVECSTPKFAGRTFVNITNIAMVTKTAGKDTLVYVADITSGMPMPNTKIYAEQDGSVKQVGTTIEGGLLKLPNTQTDGDLVLMARYQKSVALTSNYVTPLDSAGQGRILVLTDRPIYRPGDLVQGKGIVRVLEDNRLTLPKATEVNIEVRDGDEVLVQKDTRPISDLGTYTFEFKTSPEAAPGFYSVIAKVGGLTSRRTVEIAAYRKPEYEINIKPEAKNLVIGDRLKGEIDCKYYFGSPVAGAKVALTVWRSPIWDTGDPEEDYYLAQESGSSGYGGGEYSESVDLITDANGKVSFNLPTRSENEPDVTKQDYSYTISAYVQDAGNKSFQGETQVRVNRGDYRVYVNLSEYLLALGGQANVRVRLVDNNDVTQSPKGQTVELEYGRENWTGSEAVFKQEGILSATTDDSGTANFSVKPSAEGSYLLRARVKDAKGRLIQTDGYVYVGSGEAPTGPSADFQLKLDRRTAKPNEAIQAFLTTNDPGGCALITVEGEGLYNTQIVPLNKGATPVSFPFDQTKGPNAFVSAVYIRNKRFNQVVKEVSIERSETKFNLSITPDRPKAKPGDWVTFKIKAWGRGDVPVKADVALSVVDEAIYAIRSDNTDLVRGMYPRIENRVSTSFSFPEIYLDGGDKGGGRIPIRSKFKDTANWTPNISTDQMGEATVRVQLPDNLTTWRATACGVTTDAAAVAATTKVVAKKDLMVRLSPPTYLVVGDNQRITLTVSNETDKAQDVNLGLDVKGLTLKSSVPKSLKLGAGKSESVDLEVAAEASGEATLEAKTWIDGGDNDGVRQSFSVQPRGVSYHSTQSGSVGTGANLLVDVAPTLDRTVGNLSISIAPSIASSMVQSLDSLIQFPYGCVEQTTSRFLPAVLLAKSPTAAPLIPAATASKIPAIAADSYARLAKMQQPSGAWGWWEYGDGSAYMTGMVLDSAALAAQVGYPAPEQLKINKALEWGTGTLAKPGKDIPQSDLLMLALGMSQHGKGAEVKKFIGGIRPKIQTGADLAVASLALLKSGDRPGAAEMISKLKAKIVGPQDVAYVEEKSAWYFGSESTAIAARALGEFDANDPVLPKMIRHLMQARGAEGWYSTRETTMTILALNAYDSVRPVALAPATLTVEVNGEKIRTVTLDLASAQMPDLNLSVPMSKLKVGKNEVKITSDQQSGAYFAVRLSGVDTSPVPMAIKSPPMSIERAYYLLEPERMSDGTTKLMPTKKPISSAKSGDVIRCELTIKSATDQPYVMIEDAIPSNCRITEREDPAEGEDWSYWWAKTVITDRKVAFFVNLLPKGTQKLTYNMRAESPGKSVVLPTRIENMYDQNRGAFGTQSQLEVRQ